MAEKFNSKLAERYGITAALLIGHIWREVKENEFHNRCRYGGEHMDAVQQKGIYRPSALS